MLVVNPSLNSFHINCVYFKHSYVYINFFCKLQQKQDYEPISFLKIDYFCLKLQRSNVINPRCVSLHCRKGINDSFGAQMHKVVEERSACTTNGGGTKKVLGNVELRDASGRHNIRNIKIDFSHFPSIGNLLHHPTSLVAVKSFVTEFKHCHHSVSKVLKLIGADETTGTCTLSTSCTKAQW